MQLISRLIFLRNRLMQLINWLMLLMPIVERKSMNELKNAMIVSIFGRMYDVLDKIIDLSLETFETSAAS